MKSIKGKNMAISNFKERSTFEKILSSIWIVFSIIPFFNGIGVLYVGSKSLNKKWIIEGFIYEIPWFLVFLLSPTGYLSLMGKIIVLGLIFGIIAFIRSLIINFKYQELLDDGEAYRKSHNKLQSFVFLLLSALLLVNGAGFIYIGNLRKNKNLIVEGIIYEVPWVLGLLTWNSTFLALGLALIFISFMRFMVVNYSDDELSYVVNGDKLLERTESRKLDVPDQIKGVKVDLNKVTKEIKNKGSHEKTNPYAHYRTQFIDLKDSFDLKEDKLSELIEKRFPSSTITYDKFMSVVRSSHVNFYAQFNSGINIIDLALEDTPKIENELLKKMDILKSIIAKIDELSVELVINNNEEKEADENLKILVEEMENLIDSVKDYK